MCCYIKSNDWTVKQFPRNSNYRWNAIILTAAVYQLDTNIQNILYTLWKYVISNKNYIYPYYNGYVESNNTTTLRWKSPDAFNLTLKRGNTARLQVNRYINCKMDVVLSPFCHNQTTILQAPRYLKWGFSDRRLKYQSISWFQNRWFNMCRKERELVKIFL